MKHATTALLLLMAALAVLAGCDLLGIDDDNGDGFSPRGLVEFVGDPTWDEDRDAIVVFAKITFGTPVTERDLEIAAVFGEGAIASMKLVVLSSPGGSTVLSTGEVLLTFFSPEALEPFRGQDLVIWLDPSNLVTSAEYQSEAEVNTHKKRGLFIPTET